MSTRATLVYHATVFGPTSPAALEAAMAALTLDPTPIQEATGAVLFSDTTGLAGSVATRTIVFNISPATFVARFPAGTDQASPFRDLYTHQLAAGLKTVITADAVVLS